ncbi:MAG: hypothetical protein V3S02_04230 [Dehalococcoidales bacterium]
MIVAHGQYTVIMEGKRIKLAAGEEILIPESISHREESVPGTRTIHAFGGKRAIRG